MERALLPTHANALLVSQDLIAPFLYAKNHVETEEIAPCQILAHAKKAGQGMTVQLPSVHKSATMAESASRLMYASVNNGEVFGETNVRQEGNLCTGMRTGILSILAGQVLIAVPQSVSMLKISL